MGENGFEIIRKYMYILKIKSTYLNALLSFLLSSRFSNRSDAFLASFSFFGFPPLRRSKKAAHSISDRPPLEAKKIIEITLTDPIPTQNYRRGLSASSRRFPTQIHPHNARYEALNPTQRTFSIFE